MILLGHDELSEPEAWTKGEGSIYLGDGALLKQRLRSTGKARIKGGKCDGNQFQEI